MELRTSSLLYWSQLPLAGSLLTTHATSSNSHISLILYHQYFRTSTSGYSYFSVSFSDSVPSVFSPTSMSKFSWKSEAGKNWNRFLLNYRHGTGTSIWIEKGSPHVAVALARILGRHFYSSFNVRLTSENRFAKAWLFVEMFRSSLAQKVDSRKNINMMQSRQISQCSCKTGFRILKTNVVVKVPRMNLSALSKICENSQIWKQVKFCLHGWEVDVDVPF